MTRHRVKVWRTECHKWAWCCTLCQPPAHGATDIWTKTMANVQRHGRRRTQHHAYVRSRA